MNNARHLNFAILLVGCAILVYIKKFSCTSLEAGNQKVEVAQWRSFGSLELLDYAQFKRVFKKHYASYTEELRRHKLFVARYLRAAVSLLKYKWNLLTSHLGINHLSDRTAAERARLSIKSARIKRHQDFDTIEVRNRLAGKKRKGIFDVLDKVKNYLAEDSTIPPSRPSDIKVIYGYDVDSKSDVPITFDSRKFPNKKQAANKTEGEHYNLIETGCFNPPGNQDDCGSCYVFTGIAIAEYLFCRSFKRSIKFSEQFVIDCGKPFGLDGCEGGTFSELSKFIEILGFEVNQWYPYQAKDGECRFLKKDNPKRLTGVKSAGYVRMKSKPKRLVGAEDDWESFLQLGIPLDVTIAIDDDQFADYAGGVDLGNVTDEENLHSMTLVGSGMERGVEYWLLRNSFGIDWGDRGHYKIKKGCPAIEEEGLGETFEAFLNKDLAELFEFNPNYRPLDKAPAEKESV